MNTKLEIFIEKVENVHGKHPMFLWLVALVQRCGASSMQLQATNS
jgi:hypothetical protein